MQNKDFKQQDKKQQQPQAREQHQGGRKNEEEVGEPIQLDDDKMKQGQQKPDMGREGQHGEPQKSGQHQGGQPQGNR